MQGRETWLLQELLVKDDRSCSSRCSTWLGCETPRCSVVVIARLCSPHVRWENRIRQCSRLSAHTRGAVKSGLQRVSLCILSMVAVPLRTASVGHEKDGYAYHDSPGLQSPGGEDNDLHHGGLLLSFLPGLPTITLDPALLLFPFLPPLIYSTVWTPVRESTDPAEPGQRYS